MNQSSFDFTTLFFVVVVFAVLFFIGIQIARWYVCYVAKINYRIALMEWQNELLKKIAINTCTPASEFEPKTATKKHPSVGPLQHYEKDATPVGGSLLTILL